MKLVFFTPDTAGRLLTLGKEPSWRLYRVTQHNAHQSLHFELTVQRGKRVPPTLERSPVHLENAREPCQQPPQILEIPRHLQHAKWKVKMQ